jgi:hypothetical protein
MEEGRSAGPVRSPETSVSPPLATEEGLVGLFSRAETQGGEHVRLLDRLLLGVEADAELLRGVATGGD